MKFQAPRQASCREKTFGTCVISCVRAGDPCGKYLTVLWGSLDSARVGEGALGGEGDFLPSASPL